MTATSLQPTITLTPQKPLGGNLPSLTGMRWAAAFGVFGFHIYTHGFLQKGRGAQIISTAFAPGAVGVEFFFILSGFVLMWSTRPGDNPLRFLRRRFARIYPLHFVTAILALILAYTIGSVWVPPADPLVTNLLLIHSWWGDFAHTQSLNKVSWSLVCEAFFYMTFPVWAWLLHRLKVRGSLVFVAMSFCVIFAVAYLGWIHVVGEQINFYPPARLAEFTLGIGLARLVMLNKWRGPGLAASLCIALICYFMAMTFPGAYINSFSTVFGFALLIPAAAVADIKGTESFWRRPGVVRLGELSFAFYMIHLLVIDTAQKLFPQLLDMQIQFAVPVIICLFLISLGLAWVLYEFVENPARILLTGKRRSQKPVKPQLSTTEALP